MTKVRAKVTAKSSADLRALLDQVIHGTELYDSIKAELESQDDFEGWWIPHRPALGPTVAMVCPGRPVPQSRPRLGRHGAHYTKNSTEYRTALTYQLRSQWAGPALVKPVRVVVKYAGMHKNCDPDNLLKQVIDAMQDAGVIEKDTWPAIPDLRALAVDGEARVEVEVTVL